MGMERLKKTVEQILGRLPAVRGRGEEATKQALILPMLDALGYDIWNPAEVCPEYEADFAVKKMGQKEKADFAVILGDAPRIYVEVKSADTPLAGHHGQLARYFNATPSVSLGILTNGLEYWLFTDTGDPNVMDSEPFFRVQLEGLDQGIEVLARFHKSVFSPEAIREYATELNYTAKMVEFLRRELDLREREASEELVRWILGSERMYGGRVTANVVERFAPIAKNAIQIVLREVVRRSVAALDKEVMAAPRAGGSVETIEAAVERAVDPSVAGADLVGDGAPGGRNGIETTERELDCFAIVKEIFEASKLAQGAIYDSAARREVAVQLAYKDTTGYFAIYLNKPSWWGLRVSIESRTAWVAFNVDAEAGQQLIPSGFRKLEAHPWGSFRVGIEKPEDLRALAPLIGVAFEAVVRERKPGRAAEAKA